MTLICRHLGKTYQTRQGTVEALRDVSFTIREREFVCVVGPSGCGKTTLLKIIAGLLDPSTGAAEYAFSPTGNALHSVMVFQDQGLFPWMSVIDNITIGLGAQGVRRSEQIDRAHELIESFGLLGFEKSLPHELSGGMRQRVALARAFITDAHMFLMDEPFAALDAQIKLILQEELLSIWQKHRRTVIYVTHDIEEAVRLADYVIIMTGRPGQVRENVPIPIKRPRSLTETASEVSDIKWNIWKILENEVRRDLSPAASA
jgi:NitT/TauT family transport system ATP-binding protein